jgi:hypothetical protein
MIQNTLIDLCRQLDKRKCNIILNYLIIILAFVIVISFLFLNAFSQSNHSIPTPSDLIISERLLQEVSFNQYIFRSYREKPIGWGVFQIFKDDNLVYQSDIDIKFWIEEVDDSILKMGTDITGDGQPNLVVFHWCGNAYGTGDRYVFSIGEEFKLIQILPYGYFEDVNNDRVLEFIAYDNTFSFWHASHAGSPYPKLIYEYKKDNYQLSPALMYKPLPTTLEEEKAIIQIKKYITECEERGWKDLIWYYEGTYLPSLVWSYMLDLLYSGHPLEARQFLDKVWPQDKSGKELFLFNFKEKLNGSNYWREVREGLYKTPEEKEIWKMKDEGKPEGYGQLTIISTPEGASIYFDDEPKGRTPLTLTKIFVGPHKLRLDSSGYEDWEEYITISSLQKKEMNIELVAKTGDTSVRVTTSPKGAAVYLDDTYMGEGPITLKKVAPGEHLLKVSKKGYEDWSDTLTFHPGEYYFIETFLKHKGYGQIRITSTPEGASIIFDEEYKGKTPLTLSEIPVGEHKLKLDSSGYEDWEENILVSSIQVKEVDVELVAKTGDAIVKVWPIPKEAEVFLDGVYVGKGFLLLEKVSPGEHILKVTKKDYKDWESTLSFYPGETHIVSAELKAKEEVSFKNPVFILIGLVIFSIVVLYYEGLKREKNKKGSN